MSRRICLIRNVIVPGLYGELLCRVGDVRAWDQVPGLVVIGQAVAVGVQAYLDRGKLGPMGLWIAAGPKSIGKHGGNWQAL